MLCSPLHNVESAQLPQVEKPWHRSPKKKHMTVRFAPRSFPEIVIFVNIPIPEVKMCIKNLHNSAYSYTFAAI